MHTINSDVCSECPTFRRLLGVAHTKKSSTTHSSIFPSRNNLPGQNMTNPDDNGDHNTSNTTNGRGNRSTRRNNNNNNSNNNRRQASNRRAGPSSCQRGLGSPAMTHSLSSYGLGGFAASPMTPEQHREFLIRTLDSAIALVEDLPMPPCRAQDAATQ